MDRWELRLLFRAFRLGALASLLALFVTAATDEGGLSLAVRVGRTVPVVPLCSALGVALALISSRARGEPRALSAIGRRPVRLMLPAAAGGALVSVIAAVAVLSPLPLDLTGFFPTIVETREFQDEAGLFVDSVRGVAVTKDGRILRGPGRQPPPLVRASDTARAVAAALSLLFGGVACSLLAARRGVGDARPLLLDALATALFVALSIFAFHAAAAGKLAAVEASLPSLVFLVWNVARLRFAVWAFAEPTSV